MQPMIFKQYFLKFVTLAAVMFTVPASWGAIAATGSEGATAMSKIHLKKG
ncbi:MAG: hypothetical protein JST80_02925 [Bdellovibrionales bacterium]|nr:hypothetical protein [Bdellovibrionales bacterium]